VAVEFILGDVVEWLELIDAGIVSPERPTAPKAFSVSSTGAARRRRSRHCLCRNGLAAALTSSKTTPKAVVADIAAKGGKAIAVKGDVAKSADVERLFR